MTNNHKLVLRCQLRQVSSDDHFKVSEFVSCTVLSTNQCRNVSLDQGNVLMPHVLKVFV